MSTRSTVESLSVYYPPEGPDASCVGQVTVVKSFDTESPRDRFTKVEARLGDEVVKTLEVSSVFTSMFYGRRVNRAIKRAVDCVQNEAAIRYDYSGAVEQI